MPGAAKISWLTPAAMVGALVVGVVLALGHDLFYNSLAGTSATDGVYTIGSSEVSRQQMNLAIGTAFAFLVKASLVSAVSLAYLQCVWRAARGDDRPITLANMDVFMSALGNAVSLANFATWWKWPLLLLIALIAWLIPLASIVTPAALTVGITHPPSQLLHVPDIAFTGLSLLAPMYVSPNAGITPACDITKVNRTECSTSIPYSYNGPSNAVKRVVAATAAQGTILTVDAPAANSSWSLKFRAPSLRCSDVTGSQKREFERSIANFSLANCKQAPGFTAWTPPDWPHEVDRVLLPYLESDEGNYTLNAGTPSYRHWQMDMPMFLAITPSLMKLNGEVGEMVNVACQIAKSEHSYEKKVDYLFNSTAKMLRCDMYNSTYQTDFSFVDGNQNIDVKVTDVANKSYSSINDVSALYEEGTNGPCDALNTNNEFRTHESPRNCTFYTSLLQQLSYQAVMDAFEELITGQAKLLQGSGSLEYTLTTNTSISNTVLAQTPELEFLTDTSKSFTQIVTDLQSLRPSWDDSLYVGLSNDRETIGTSLKDTIELLFQNVTVSLMSSPMLWSNKSSAFYPSKTNVTISTSLPTYVYARDRLWLAYGLAVAFSTLTVAIGLIMVALNGASFDDTFSNLLWLSRNAELSIEDKRDSDGKGPSAGSSKGMEIKFQKGGIHTGQYSSVPA